MIFYSSFVQSEAIRKYVKYSRYLRENPGDSRISKKVDKYRRMLGDDEIVEHIEYIRTY
jgi:hypothetical protein